MVPRMATLGDVARRAGVSAASVSRVLNHPAKVSPAVRERIVRAMDELGYVRDGAARALASRHSDRLFAHLALSEAGEQGQGAAWGAHVSDAEYNEAASGG